MIPFSRSSKVVVSRLFHSLTDSIHHVHTFHYFIRHNHNLHHNSLSYSNIFIRPYSIWTHTYTHTHIQISKFSHIFAVYIKMYFIDLVHFPFLFFPFYYYLDTFICRGQCELHVDRAFHKSDDCPAKKKSLNAHIMCIFECMEMAETMNLYKKKKKKHCVYPEHK